MDRNQCKKRCAHGCWCDWISYGGGGEEALVLGSCGYESGVAPDVCVVFVQGAPLETLRSSFSQCVSIFVCLPGGITD